MRLRYWLESTFLIAGTCSIEGLEMSLDVAGQLKEMTEALGIPLIYKGSF